MTLPSLIRVIVADDHDILRAGVKQFIDNELDMRVTAEAATGDDVIRLVRSESFDIVLLDISMPQKNGIDCLKIIRQFNATLPILILSSFPEKSYAMNMLKLGANGYFQKGDNPAELIEAIRKVAAGHTFVSSDTAETLTDALARPSSKGPHELLSTREYQVFHKLALGGKNGEIAKELNLSTKTVSTYRTRILGKFNAQTNAELTRYAMKNGLMN